jgi:hypothetical protein
MRSLSLEQFYKRIKNKIAIVGGYIEDKSICSIIKSCRLKPITVFTEHFDFKTLLEPVWIGEDQNIAIEIKKKKAKVITLLQNETHSMVTDIFKNETVKFIVEHSSYACVGLYPGTENFILLLMGTDNYFRCYECMDDCIKIISPLIVGLKILKCCVTMKSLTSFQKLTIKSELKPVKDVEWFIVPLPAQKLFMLNIVAYNKLRSILYNE